MRFLLRHGKHDVLHEMKEIEMNSKTKLEAINFRKTERFFECIIIEDWFFILSKVICSNGIH